MIGVIELARTGLLLGLVYFIGYATYNIFFHPLRKFPGPLSHRMMVLPRTYYHVTGVLPFHVRELHKRYGPIVRLGPSELVFCSPQAWHDVYGPKKGDRPELPKYRDFYHMFDHVPTSVLNAPPQEHSLLRRQLNYGFSDRAMFEQEPIIGGYVNQLISKLRAAAETPGRQNLRDWLGWTTFDLISDLSFGVEGGFGSLRDLKTHPWVELITGVILQSTIIQALFLYGFRQPMTWVAKSGILASSKHLAFLEEKVRQRIESGDRPDFLQGLISNMDALGITSEKLITNAGILIFAGSETTASLLCGATYFLTTHPEKLKRLQEEVRSAFKSDDEIRLTTVGNLSYMMACLNESLRHYPPAASGLPREVPKGGVTITGEFVPEGTVVSVHHWSMNHDKRFWTEPETFAPERFMGDPKYKDDQPEAMQPFGVGPRNCLGRNLAYAEMRLILAKLIYNFDITLDEESRDWMNGQKVFELWIKPPLYVHLKPVAR